VIDVLQLGEWVAAFGVLLCIPMLAQPASRRLLAPLLERFTDWAKKRAALLEDAGETEMTRWLAYERRLRLGADLRRVELLLRTDMGRSATRQLGNRLAYEQLLDDLRRLPEVEPALAGASLLPSPYGASDEFSHRFVRDGSSAGAPVVEILEIGRRPRR
jgi:hypothetical protein